MPVLFHKTLRTKGFSAIGFLVIFLNQYTFAEYHGATFLAHSPLASSNSTGDVNIALHKAVFVEGDHYEGYLPKQTDTPAKLFDGDQSTSTLTGNLAVDLGDDYVVDSIYVNMPNPTIYQVLGSLYWGPTPLAPTYNLTTGLGKIPKEEQAFLEYTGFMIIADPKPMDKRKVLPTVCRFLNFEFATKYDGSSYSRVAINEIEVYGHLYKPQLGDRKSVSHRKWVASAFADAAPGGEGQTVTHGIDGHLGYPWQPQKNWAAGQWYQIDMGEEVSFDQIHILYVTAPAKSYPNGIQIFATNDLSNWGSPISEIPLADSVTASFSTQKKRYLKFVTANAGSDWWGIDAVYVLAAVDLNSVSLRPSSHRVVNGVQVESKLFHSDFLGRRLMNKKNSK